MNLHFSLVVPTFNRPQQLAACLAALAQLAYPQDCFEVVVVDDGGTTPLEPIVAPLRQRITLSLHRQANAGPASARNAGAAQARNAYLAFTDDDCAPDANWLAQLAQQLAATPDVLASGRTRNALPDNPYAAASQSLVSYLASYQRAKSAGTHFAASNNIALSRSAFGSIGGFDTTFPLAAGEDREFCDRWLATGRQIVCVPEAIVVHRHDLALATFWRQHVQYGRGAFQVRRIRAAHIGQRIQLEQARFYGGLLSYPFREMCIRPAAVQAGLLALAQVATTAGFLTERWRWRKLNEARNNDQREPGLEQSHGTNRRN